jgi:hypothetical protein
MDTKVSENLGCLPNSDSLPYRTFTESLKRWMTHIRKSILNLKHAQLYSAQTRLNIKTAQQLLLGFPPRQFWTTAERCATDVKTSVQALWRISMAEHQICLEVLTKGFQDQIKTHLPSLQVKGRRTYATPHPGFFSVPCTKHLISYRNSTNRSLQTILALVRGFCKHMSDTEVWRFCVTETGPFG